MKEIEDYRKKTNEELSKQAKILNAYRDKVNELGSEDVAQLKNSRRQSETILPITPTRIRRRRIWTSSKTRSSVPSAAL